MCELVLRLCAVNISIFPLIFPLCLTNDGALLSEQIKASRPTEPLWRRDADWQLAACSSSCLKTPRRCQFICLCFEAPGLFCEHHAGGSNEVVFFCLLRSPLVLSRDVSKHSCVTNQILNVLSLQRDGFVRRCTLLSHGCQIIIIYMYEPDYLHIIDIHSFTQARSMARDALTMQRAQSDAEPRSRS